MKWVSIKDRLPKKHEDVLAFRPDDGIIITRLSWMLDSEPIWADEVSNYTHWMPLPEPPKE